jgi:hypothetical protein
VKRLAFIVLLAALSSRVSYAEHVIPSVPLGATGLDINVTIRLLEYGEIVESDESSASVVITDHADGSYGFSGLPDATGRDRYVLLAATSDNPTQHLFRYEWGAESGTSIVYETVDASVPQEPIVQGDTFGTVSYVVLSGLPSNIGSATATFTAINARTKTAIVSDRPAVISLVTLDATTNTHGATFTYDLESTFTTNPVSYSAEFTIIVPGGEQITLPRTPIRGEIRKQL